MLVSGLSLGKGTLKRTSAFNVFAIFVIAMEPDIYMTLFVS